MPRFGLSKKSRAVRDFVTFGSAMIHSGDIDPQFWILRRYYKTHRVDKNTALWLSFLYLTFYHLGSASVAWRLWPQPVFIRRRQWEDVDLFFFKQRRLFRGNTHGLDHLDKAIRWTDGDFVSWVEEAVGNGGPEGWARVRAAYSILPYTGPWSSYKWCDMMKFVHKYPITAPDIGNKPGGTAGPIAGLSSLTGLSWEECAGDFRIHDYLYDFVTGELGMPLHGMDQLESCLCDYQSIINGRYYCGHDIDRDLAQLQKYDENEVTKYFYKARDKIFDHRYLGEHQPGLFEEWNWSGVRKELKSRYRDKKELVNVFADVKRVKI